MHLARGMIYKSWKIKGTDYEWVKDFRWKCPEYSVKNGYDVLAKIVRNDDNHMWEFLGSDGKTYEFKNIIDARRFVTENHDLWRKTA